MGSNITFAEEVDMLFTEKWPLKTVKGIYLQIN